MNLSEYAKHRNVALNAVQTAILSGRISIVIDENGKKRIDPDQADKDWIKNTDPSKQNNMKKSNEFDMSKIPPLHESRAVRAFFESKLTQLEYGERSKELLNADEVRTECFSLARRVRDSILQIPDRISSQLAAEVDSFRIFNLLTAELTTALRGLADLEKI